MYLVAVAKKVGILVTSP